MTSKIPHLLDADIATRLTDSLINLVGNVGTHRDKMSYSNFSGGRFGGLRASNIGSFNLNYEKFELESMYQDDWLSGKVVDVPVDDMLREWRTFSFGDNHDLVAAYEKVEDDFGVRSQIRDALKWSRLYGGAGIIMGIDGAGDAALPLDINRVTKGSLKFLRTVDMWHLTPTDINFTDISQRNFAKPEFYRLSYTDKLIHHSRILIFEGLKMPFDVANKLNFWGQSILVRGYQALINAATVSHITGSLLLESVTETISIKNLLNIIGSQQGTQRLQNRFGTAKLLQSVNNIRLLDSEETYERDQLQFAEFPDLIKELHQLVSGAFDIPGVRLFGRSISGLNATGEEDRRNYFDMLKSHQTTQLTPVLNYLDEILLRSTFGMVPQDYSWRFEPLWQISDSEQADIQLKNAQRDSVYDQIGAVTPAMISKNLQTDEVYPIDDEFISAQEQAFTEEDLLGQQTQEPDTVAFAPQTKLPLATGVNNQNGQ